jgi:SAM-dependent methyltransferase
MLPPPRSVLDAGCGDAMVAAAIAHRWRSADVVGVEIDGAALAQAEAIADSVENLSVRKAAVGGQPLDRKFDLVVCIDVLEHIEDDESALDWLARHVAPAGTLVVHVPATPQRHWIPSLARAMREEIAAGTSPHAREGYEMGDLCARLTQRKLDVLVARNTFHRAVVQLAEDIDSWLHRHRRRPLKAVLAPLLLAASSLERRTWPGRSGNGVLVVAVRRNGVS